MLKYSGYIARHLGYLPPSVYLRFFSSSLLLFLLDIRFLGINQVEKLCLEAVIHCVHTLHMILHLSGTH